MNLIVTGGYGDSSSYPQSGIIMPAHFEWIVSVKKIEFKVITKSIEPMLKVIKNEFDIKIIKHTVKL